MKGLDWTPSNVRMNVGDRITISGDPAWIARLQAMGWKVNAAGHAEGVIGGVVTASAKGKSSKAPPKP